MRWENVCIEAITCHLPQERVTSSSLEGRLAPLYEHLHLPMGQLEQLSGVRERRFWPHNPPLGILAAEAAQMALEEAGVDIADIGALIYCGVCRENLEPATACVTAATLGLSGEALILDHSNACLGVLNGIVSIANMIELGQIRAGVVVSTESAREIGDDTIARMLAEPSINTWKNCLASLTGGSGAVAVVLTAKDFSWTQRRLLGGVALSAPEHHRIARWGPREGLLGQTTWVMETDAPAVLKHGIALGQRTWKRFLETLDWHPSDAEKVILHQVGKGHQQAILRSLEIPSDREFSTFDTLGNMGSVALLGTTAIAASQGFINTGDQVALLGIGTGLNCLMLGIQW